MAPERRPAQTRRPAGGAAPLVPSLHGSTTRVDPAGISPRAADPASKKCWCGGSVGEVCFGDGSGREERSGGGFGGEFTGGGSSSVASEQAWMVVVAAVLVMWPPSRRGWWWRIRQHGLFLFFLEKKFVECFLGTRQRLYRVYDKKHSAN